MVKEKEWDKSKPQRASERRVGNDSHLMDADTKQRTHTQVDPAMDGDMVSVARAMQTESHTEMVEKTLSRSRPMSRAARPGAKLKVLSGPQEGTEQRLKFSPARVGRLSNLDLVITDPKVSGAHLELSRAKGAGYWTVEDLESTSGTLLCGEVLEGAKRIRHGDLIHIGETQLRFFTSSIPAEEREPFAVEKKAEDPPVSEDDPPSDAGAVEEAEAEDEKSWAFAARPQISVSVPDEPKSSNRGVISFGIFVGVLLLCSVGYWTFQRTKPAETDFAKFAEQSAQLLEEAKKDLAAGKLELAYVKLQTIRSLPGEHTEADALYRDVRGRQEGAAVLARAQELVRSAEYDRAEVELQKIPDSSPFRAERDRLRALLVAAKAPIPEQQAKKARDRVVMQARQLFSEDDVAGAKSLLDSIAKPTAAQRSYRSKLAEFESYYGAGERAVRRKSGDAAADLQRAYQLAGKLGTSDTNAVRIKMRPLLANALYLASISQKASDPCVSAKRIFEAAEFSPDDEKIVTQLNEVETAAQKALTRAEAVSGTAAGEIAKGALCLTQPGSATRGRLMKILATQ